jgi:hypothetical protein
MQIDFMYAPGHSGIIVFDNSSRMVPGQLFKGFVFLHGVLLIFLFRDGGSFLLRTNGNLLRTNLLKLFPKDLRLRKYRMEIKNAGRRYRSRA